MVAPVLAELLAGRSSPRLMTTTRLLTSTVSRPADRPRLCVEDALWQRIAVVTVARTDSRPSYGPGVPAAEWHGGA
jgi:hypothetical protein